MRDLWGLRLGVLHSEAGAGGGSEKFSTAGFSSASEAENTDSDAVSVGSRRSARSSRSEAGREKVPKLVETLALCYLGMVLMRLPVSLGELHAWATRDEMGYMRAVSIDHWFLSYFYYSDKS